jgi:formylglycine-generating enzyme required for sulfatase activity
MGHKFSKNMSNKYYPLGSLLLLYACNNIGTATFNGSAVLMDSSISLSLSSPTLSPDTDDTPTVLVSGLKSGQIINLFSDSTCSTQVGQVTSSGATALVTSSSLPVGSYQFAFNVTENGSTSSCSGAKLTYEVSTITPTLTFGTWITPSSAPTAGSPAQISKISFTVLGAQSGETVSIYTDSGCTSSVGSGAASGTPVTATILTNSLPIGTSQTINLYAQGSITSGCQNLSETFHFSCPTGYVPVPKNSAVDAADDFCVMKWEAKCATDINGATSCASATGASSATQVAVSTAQGLPWRSITQIEASAACTNLNSLNGVTNRYDLVSNPEWMAIARNIEGTASNWSNGSVGSGALSVGHANSDSGPFRACNGTLSNVATNDCTVAGTDPNYKRTHTLSNAQIIWDIPGNVWEWVDWTMAPGLATSPSCPTLNFIELSSVSSTCIGNFQTKEYLPALSYTGTMSNFNLGQFHTGSGGAVIRGGEWYDDLPVAGIYAMMVNHSQVTSMPEIGFRCVYRPYN